MGLEIKTSNRLSTKLNIVCTTDYKVITWLGVCGFGSVTTGCCCSEEVVGLLRSTTSSSRPENGGSLEEGASAPARPFCKNQQAQRSWIVERLDS